MKRNTRRVSEVLKWAGLAVVTVCVWAQGPGGGARPSTPASSANQLPLSGRTGQTGSVGTVQSAIPGTTTSVNTLNTNVQIQGPYTGSTTTLAPEPGEVTLTLRDALRRGLEFNLGPVQLSNALRQARGQTKSARSGLLPNISSELAETVQKTSLVAFGIRAPGLPSVAGPFNFFDLRARLSQTFFDLTTWNNYRSAQENERVAALLITDARDLVVLAVTGTYLQTQAAAARVEAARSQIETANALLRQASERNEVGLTARIDVNRAQVQVQTQQQRLTSLENDLAKQKLNLARLIGLPAGQLFALTTTVSSNPMPAVTLENALAQARTARADLRAAEVQVTAAERARSAARAERYPTLAFNADYGAIGTNPSRANGTYNITGSLRIPVWQGGRTEGSIEQAQASLLQRQAELSDTKGRIETEVRSAMLDLEAASSQVKVAEANRQVTRETLTLAKQRFEAGIADAVEVTQAQEEVAVADQDQITSLTAFNIAKVTLARAMGRAEENVIRFLGLP